MPLLLAAMLLAAPPGGPPPRFVAHSTAADAPAGPLLKLAADGAVTPADGPAVPAGQLVALRRADAALPPWPHGPGLILANGDRVDGAVVGGSESVVRFRPAAGGEWAVPLAAVAAVWLVPPPADLPPDPARYPWRRDARRSDAVWQRNGDILLGTVEAVSADALSLAGGKGQPTRAIPFGSVAAVGFDPSLARVRRPKGPHYRLVLTGGDRITLAAATADGTTLTGTTPFGATVTIPLAAVTALDVVGGKAVPLSDLKPTRAEVVPYLGLSWPWAADRTVKGLPLRLPGAGWFDKGLGTHPRTTLSYALGGKYRRFEARVGLDAVTGRHGAAAVRVLADGHDVTPPGLARLAAADAAVAVRVDITGANELTLVTDFGPAGDVEADVDWADARVVE